MALLFVDPFDSVAQGTDITKLNKYASNNIQIVGASSDSISVVPSTISISALRSRGNQMLRFITPSPSELSGTITVGVSFGISTGLTLETDGFHDFNNHSVIDFGYHQQTRLTVNNDMSLSMGTVRSDPNVLIRTAYNYIEVTFNYTTYEFVVYVNDTLVLEGTSTAIGTNPFIQFGGEYPGIINRYTFYDNIYILDDTGDAPFNARLGPVKALPLLYNEVVENTFTPVGTENVLDIVNKINMDETTYLKSPSQNTGDSYKLDTSTLTEDDDILAVSTITYYKTPELGSSALDSTITDGINTITQTNGLHIGSFVGNKQMISETAPDGTTWDLTKLQNAEFGYKVAQ